MRPAAGRARCSPERVPGQAGRCRRTPGSRNDPQPLAAIDAAADAIPPRAIGEIPLDRLAQSRLEGLLRLPAEVGRDLRSVDGIAQIVSRTVRHERDERFTWADLP